MGRVVEKVEAHEVTTTTCDICGKVINATHAPYSMEWYVLQYVGWLGERELWLCSIPCAIAWVKSVEELQKLKEKERGLPIE